MDRDAAHAAIVLILSHDIYEEPRALSDVADDILDAIWPDPAVIWNDAYYLGRNDGSRRLKLSKNPYQPDAAQPP